MQNRPQANAESAMSNSTVGSLPRMAALRAFDAVVRHASFTLAAEELGIRQPAVSRYIAELERSLDARLLERSGRTASLTPAGEAYHLAVVLGLNRITAAARAAESLAEDRQVTLACSHEASHFLVMPHYADLRHALGEDIGIRVLTCHHSVGDLPTDPAADIRLTWDPAGARPEDRAVIFGEEVRPVCSPAYAAAHAETLAGPAAGWSELTLLDLMQPNEGWATWEDWFAVTGRPDWPPRRIEIGSYVDVLEAAVAGRGVALGWRHFVERFLEVGTLVALGDRFVGFDRTFFGVLTEKGRRKPLARRCFDFLADGTADATHA